MISENGKTLHPFCQRALGSISALLEDQKEEHANRLIKLVIDFDDALDLLHNLDELLRTSGEGTKVKALQQIQKYMREHANDA